MSELKPCPCCGSTARPVGSRSGINPHWKLCRVICDRCGLTTANHSTPEEAAAAWNRRASLPDLSCALALLKEYLNEGAIPHDEVIDLVAKYPAKPASGPVSGGKP